MHPDIYLKQAEQLLVKEGFSDFSMERLATMTGITKRTLYNNFESRDDLFECLTDMQRERIRNDTLPLFSKYGINAVDILREWYKYNIRFLSALQPTYLPSLQHHMPTWYALFSEMMNRNCKEFTALLIPRGRHEGLFIRSFNSDSFALFIQRILSTASTPTIESDIGFLTRSICTESHIRLI